jgi:hypothetical protein
LCIVCSASSAAQKARRRGSQNMNSAGASDSGAMSAASSTPSSTRRCPVRSACSVGATSPVRPTDVALPMPASTWPSGPRGSSEPYMKPARRFMALPAMTFSSAAASRKPAGASTGTRRAAASSRPMTPRTPP